MISIHTSAFNTFKFKYSGGVLLKYSQVSAIPTNFEVLGYILHISLHSFSVKDSVKSKLLCIHFIWLHLSSPNSDRLGNSEVQKGNVTYLKFMWTMFSCCQDQQPECDQVIRKVQRREHSGCQFLIFSVLMAVHWMWCRSNCRTCEFFMSWFCKAL